MNPYVIEKEFGHHLTDRAELFQETEALERFLSLEGVRRLGVRCGREVAFLLQATDQELPELLPLQETNPKLLLVLHEMREQLLVNAMQQSLKRCEQETRQLLENASAPTARRQKKINFEKEINKRMQSSKKVFFNQRMEGFDFRKINLEAAIFINCSLSNSNFSNVNLQHAIFVNCQLEDTVWYGAFLNNAFVYQANQVVALKEYQEVKHGKSQV